MPHYIFMISLNEEGRKNIKSLTTGIDSAIKQAEELGGKLIDIYGLFGEHDFLAIAEFPNDEAASIFVLSPDTDDGDIWTRVKTIKAFTMEEINSIVNKLP